MFELTRRNAEHPAYLYDPFEESGALDFFANPFGTLFSRGGFAPFRTDITDRGEEYLLETDLPGFSKKDIHLDVQGDTLCLHAERHDKAEEKPEKRIRSERSYGIYTRRFDLSGIDAEKIHAKYENGVLKLTLPKKEQTAPKGRQLDIE